MKLYQINFFLLSLISTCSLVHSKCTKNSDCPLDNSVCKQLNSDNQIANTCACSVGYQLTRNSVGKEKCQRIVGCNGNDALCKASHQNTVCVTLPHDHFSYCKCAPSFQLSPGTGESCIQEEDIFKLNTGWCKRDSQCGHRAVCNLTYGGKCECPPFTKADPNQVNCSPEKCSKDADCQLQGKLNYLACNITNGGFCYNPKLKCEIGYRLDEDKTGCKLISDCKQNEDCTTLHPNTFCNVYHSTFSRCECIRNFYLTDDNKECRLHENIARLDQQCRPFCGDNAECTWRAGGAWKTCQCKGGSKSLNDGVNCVQVKCTKGEDCTAEDKEWKCNTASHYCYDPNSSALGGDKSAFFAILSVFLLTFLLIGF